MNRKAEYYLRILKKKEKKEEKTLKLLLDRAQMLRNILSVCCNLIDPENTSTIEILQHRETVKRFNTNIKKMLKPIVVRVFGMVSTGQEKNTGGSGVQRKNRNNPFYIIVKIR